MKIRKNDIVKVISGSDKGKKGRVIESIPKQGMVLVEKINIVKRHQRPTQQNQQGGIIEKESPISVSKVMLVCPKCNQPTRVGRKRLSDAKKNNKRVCKKCAEVVEI